MPNAFRPKNRYRPWQLRTPMKFGCSVIHYRVHRVEAGRREPFLLAWCAGRGQPELTAQRVERAGVLGRLRSLSGDIGRPLAREVAQVLARVCR